MKYGFFKGHKVAECQDTQVHLMARFLRERTVDEWRDSDAETEGPATARGADSGNGNASGTGAGGGNGTGDIPPQDESGSGAGGAGKGKPPTKAELIAEAQALGIALTGKEKNADIAALIKAKKAEVAAIFPEVPQDESGSGVDGSKTESEEQ